MEQAAYCSLRGKRPFLRHFAMRLALAGVRFARAKQVNVLPVSSLSRVVSRPLETCCNVKRLTLLYSSFVPS